MITVSIESTMEVPSTMTVSEDLEGLPAPIGREERYSSNDKDICDEDYGGALTSEDTSAIYSDWV